MDMEDFANQVDRAWETSPFVQHPELFTMFKPMALMELAFRMGAGIGLFMAKIRGTQQLSREDIDRYVASHTSRKAFAVMAKNDE
jgi:hypothetical protein